MNYFIFLDIDGVLNQLQSWHIDKNCVEILASIVKKYNANIVLTSSWRLGYCRNIKYCSPQVRKLLGVFEGFGLAVYGRTENLGDRQKEIERYVETHGVGRYVILDDDASLFDQNVKDLYLVSPKTGLIKKDIKGVCHVLNE